jgi:hypothetical protein
MAMIEASWHQVGGPPRDGPRATEADVSQDPAPAEFSRLVVGEVPSASEEL